MRRRRKTELRQAFRQPANVTLHDWPEIGVDHRRGHALVFAEFGRHFVADTNVGLRELLGEDVARYLFVLRTDETIQETDRDGLNPNFAQAARRLPHRLFVELGLNRAVVAEPLRDFEAEVTRNQNGRFIGLQIIQVGTLLPPDLQEIAKTCRRDQASRHAAVLDERVRCNGRTVTEVLHLLWQGLHPLYPFLDALDDAPGGVVGRRRDFPHFEPAERLLKQADVGKGPA